MEKPLYRYLATVNKVIDGDSVNLTIDEGFRHKWTTTCRMMHINASEMNSPDPDEREKAKAAFNFLSRRLPVGTQVYIISKNLDKYGRPEVEIYLNGKSINKELVEEGFAVVYKK